MVDAGDVLRLNWLEAIDNATATALARHRGSLELDGLSDLEPDVATSLASHAGDSLSLNGLHSLTTDAERALAGHDGILRLAGIHALTTAVMAEKYRRGEVRLGPIKVLSPAAAAGLAPSPRASACAAGDVTADDDHDSLDDADRPSEQDLDLPDLRLLTPEVAAALARVVEGRLVLTGLRSISAPAASALRSHGGALCLDGIEAVDDATAAALARHVGRLRMRNLRSLRSADLAAKLIESDGAGEYEWPELLEVSDAAAVALSQATGMLTIGRLHVLSVGAARAFAGCQGLVTLHLDHLAELTDECAEALAGFSGQSLYLGRPHVVSPRAEDILRENSAIHLTSLEEKVDTLIGAYRRRASLRLMKALATHWPPRS